MFISLLILPIFFISILGFIVVLIDPTNFLFMRWSHLKEKQRAYGSVFYLSIAVLSIMLLLTVVAIEESGPILPFLLGMLVFVFLAFIYGKVIWTGIIPPKKTFKEFLKEAQKQSLQVSENGLQPVANKATTPFKDTHTNSDTEATNDIEKQVFSDIFQTSHKPRIFRSSPDFDMRLDETGQYDRYHRAIDCRIISIDHNKNSAIFKGTFEPQYEVTLDSCTCMDFQRRHRPCKHMYRLAHELGCCTIEGCPRGVLYDPTDIMGKYTIDAAKELIQKMNTEEQKELYGLVRQWISSSHKEWIYASDEPLSNRLVDDGFLEKITAPADTILRLFAIADLRSVLKNAGRKCPRTKEETIQQVVELGIEHYESLYCQYKLIRFDDNYKPIRGKIRSFLKMLVGEYYEYPDDGEYYDYDLPTIHAIR